MLNKHTLLTIAILSSSSTFANIPIESRGLSQGSSSYANSNASSTPAVANNINWDLIQHNQRLENQLRELRGKMEEQDHQIDQLNKELTNRYADLDQRLELLQQKIDPPEDQPENEDSSPNQSTPSAPTPSNIESKPQSTASNIKTDLSHSTDQTELDKAAYTIALDAYKQGGAKKAIAPMQNFIKNNPNSVYTGNAYFWLAEFNLAIEPPNYNEAKKHYEIVAAKFPNSSKASRSLYQLYSIAKDVNKNLQSADVYKKKLISTYPSSEEAAYFNKS